MRICNLLIFTLFWMQGFGQDNGWAADYSNFWIEENVNPSIDSQIQRLQLKFYIAVTSGQIDIYSFENKKLDKEELEEKTIILIDSSDKIILPQILKDQLSENSCYGKDEIIGWVRSEDFYQILDKQEESIYRALISKSLLLEKSKSTLLNVSLDTTASMFSEDVVLQLKTYYSTFYTNIFNILIELGIAETELDNYFFKDKKMKQPFDSIAKKLMKLEESIDPNPYDPLDPYDIVTTNIFTSIGGIDLQYVQIYKLENDYLIQGFARSIETKLLDSHWLEEKTITSKRWHQVTFTYSSIQYLLKPTDQIVLKILMSKIAKLN